MRHFKYLIIGGGMTADAAVKGIREIDSKGNVGVISSESDPPYDRPPLTKGLWKDKPYDSVWRHTEDQGIELFLQRSAKSVVPAKRTVTDNRGEVYYYDKLLLATGGTPRRLPFGEDLILYYRTLADYRRLRDQTSERRRFAVIGGGFIGSEIAAALNMNGKEVVMIFPGSQI